MPQTGKLLWLEAVLGGMLEAVLVVDTKRRLLHCNDTASRLFQFEKEVCHETPLGDFIDDLQFLDFVDSCFEGEARQKKNLVLPGEDRFWQAHGSLLRSVEDEVIGVLVVLRDVTQERRLGQIHRDFVANVSHELKTPITSIKGFVETLRDGAIAEPENANNFLRIIARHVRRLEAIIEDLLSLSRIEQSEGKAHLLLLPTKVRDIIENAMVVCEANAREMQIEVAFSCGDELKALVNPALLEQAIVNLLDNAIKYSEAGSRVEIGTVVLDGDLIVSVADQGSGIPADNLGRIFERFYRVDKARSRKLGGTGLGLAIVKHIMQAHGGQVDVASREGVGSTFRLVLPLPSAP